MTGLPRKIIICLLVVVVLGGGGWYGRKAWKVLTERRLIAQAKTSFEKQDARNAAFCLQRVLQVNPRSAAALRLMAEMLEDMDPRAALSWRGRLIEVEPDNVTNRLRWAQTALRANDPASAAQALDGIAQASRGSALFQMLSGDLAATRGNLPEAEKQYSEALRLEPANAPIQLKLCQVRLASTNGAVVEQARATLEQLATNAAVRLHALRALATDAVARTNASEAVGFARQTAAEPAASFSDKLNFLQLLKTTQSAQFEPYLSGLKNAATNVAVAFELARWIASAEGPTNALQWVESLPQQIRTSQPLQLLETDCQIAMQDWRGLLETVQKQDWRETEFYRVALEALALRSLGQRTLADYSWKKALRACSSRPDALARLVHVTSAWGWKDEHKQVLQETVARFPKEKWAADQLMAVLYQQGDTSALERLVTKIAETDPQDLRFKNNLANLYLLRKIELDKAHRLAREAYLGTTNNPFMACTYAYSLLLQKREADAVEVISKIDQRFLEISSVAAYYGIVQAETGHKEEAREALSRAETATLLPEEKELVRLAKARL